uniref:Uncharacterized protein n=1 Tax=Engystomops pustulosus TaxID=76066 RepID=A0AAV6YYT1_ENGPU|nr:hypothetical protein GDO81_021243 [Engystomops pustulosus]
MLKKLPLKLEDLQFCRKSPLSIVTELEALDPEQQQWNWQSPGEKTEFNRNFWQRSETRHFLQVVNYEHK